jgi:O-antigen/teichoic acid export membrane protein
MIGRSMLAYIPVNIANIVVSFGTIVILTRLLDSAEFGRYALGMIAIQFVHMGIFTWLEAAMVRFQARAEREGDENSHLKTIYMSGARLSVVAWVCIMAVLYFMPFWHDMKPVLVLALSSTCIQLFANLSMEAHKASHRIRRYSTLYTTQTLLSFTVGILLIMVSPLKELAPFVGIIIGILVVVALDLPFMLKRMKGGEVERRKVKTYFAYGMPICVSLLLTYALNSADMFLIKGIMGDSSAGQYNAGYNLANRSLDVFFIWIAMAVTPIAISTLEKEGIERSKEILRDYGATLLWLAMPMATGIALVAEPAGFILGESVRAEAVTVMPLIAFAGVMNGFISYYAQRAFMLSGQTHMFVWAMVPPVILNIALNMWLIPLMGLMGAVYATVLAYALGLCLSLVIGRKYYPLPIPVKAFFQISFACLVMAGVVMAVRLPESTPDALELVIKGITGSLTYGIVCYGTNTANCRNLINDIVAKIRSRRVAEAL